MVDDEKMIWRFTVKNGSVNRIGPRDPRKPEEMLRRDEDGVEYLVLPPPPSPALVQAISKSIRDNYGEGVSGEGTYDEATEMLEFEPSPNAGN